MAQKKQGNRHCCFGQCNSDQRYPERNEGVVFFPFPKPKTRLEECKIWIKACGRPHEQLNQEAITKNYFVCSRHFVDGRPTEKYPYPIPYDGQPVRRGRKRRNSDRYNEASCRQATGSTSLSVQSVPVECDNSVAPWIDTTGNPIDLLSTAAEIRRLQEENSVLRRRVQHLEAEAEKRQKPGVTESTQTQTCTCTSDMADKVRKSEIKTLF